MTDLDDLIARLLGLSQAARNPLVVADPLEHAANQAAAALEALRAENERLREALRYYAEGHYCGDGDYNGYVMPQDLMGAGDTGQIARAALSPR